MAGTITPNTYMYGGKTWTRLERSFQGAAEASSGGLNRNAPHKITD